MAAIESDVQLKRLLDQVQTALESGGKDAAGVVDQAVVSSTISQLQNVTSTNIIVRTSYQVF